MLQRILSLLLFVVMSLSTALQAQINTDRVLQIGRNALYFEDYVLSIQYFNEVIAVKPYLAEPYLYRSIAKVYLDDYLGAEQDATQCIERNPFMVTAWQVRGVARQNLQNYDGAIEDFKQGLGMRPEDKTFLRNLAISYAQKKDYARADSCFDSFVRLFPSEPTAYLNRAQLAMERNDSIKALEDLTQVLRLDKGNSYAYAMRSIILEQNGQHQEALSDLNHAIRLDPEHSAFYNNRALIRYNLNDLRGAMSDYDQALELSPDEVLSHYNRGLLRAQIGDRNNAINDFTSVLKVEPDNSFAAYNRALLRDEVGDLAGAIADYQQVFDQHPNFFPALYARSEDLRKLGRNKEAEADYRQAFQVQQRVLKERDQRDQRRREMLAQGIQNPDSILMAEAEADDSDVSDEAKVRRQDDKNIRKFNRLMAARPDDKPSRYNSQIRGRIQDRSFTVEMMPLFVLSYYEKADNITRNIYFERTLSDFNRAGLLSRRLKVVCDEPMLTQTQVQAHFASIDDYSKIIGFSGGSIINFFGRSVDYMLVQDYQSAIQDLNQVLMRKDNFILAYFNRAVMRYRQLEIDERSNGAVGQRGDDEELKNTALRQASASRFHINTGSAISTQEQIRLQNEQMQRQRRVEYELCMRDFDKVIELSPSFVYAYYNRAFISAHLNNFDAALADLNHALELYPSFAEAYYNRGLIYLRQGKTKAAYQDLSKAGELGLIQAYSVLKRAQE